MSFHEKGFWMGKGNGNGNGHHITTDGDAIFGNSSRLESKRSHQWFADATEAELFPHKRQAVESPNSKSISGYPIPTSHLSWDNVSVSALQSSQNQFMDRLLGSPDRSLNKKIVHDQLENGSTAGLSMTYTIEDPESCLNYGVIRKVKVNQVKDTENNFITMGPNYNNENDGNVTLMGHSYSGFDPTIAHRSNSTCPTSKDEENSLSFGGFHDESEMPINGYYVKAMNNYELSFDDQSTVKPLTLQSPKEVDVANAIGVTSKSNKLETKAARKEAPNSFPSNVRSLMATGILDGVPVKYVSLSREELRGVIKGSGYLCGCQSCNQSKALNAYEFERHAGCKTKHPNNHIYFESGKTIYQIVQELRTTPESLLFDAIQNVTGSPINQKAFRTWKGESFQAATRELQRIYGKDQLNI